MGGWFDIARRTIVESIELVLREERGPLTPKAIYNRIVHRGLYRFNTDNPVHVVRSQIRRHCEGLDFPSASSRKYFRMLPDGSYDLVRDSNVVVRKGSNETVPQNHLNQLRDIHREYLHSVKTELLERLRALNSNSFETFARKLLEAYGFDDVQITRASKDGGVDGFGRLRAGLAHMNVAFQCKRWNNRSIGRPKIDEFRGAIQGKFEQGIFFTTTTFTKEAESASIQPGAVPILLIDGLLIVDLMIERGFGVEKEFLPIYVNALDLVLL